MNKSKRIAAIAKSVLYLKIGKASRSNKASAAIGIATLSRNAKIKLFKEVLNDGYEGILTNDQLIVYFDDGVVAH